MARLWPPRSPLTDHISLHLPPSLSPGNLAVAFLPKDRSPYAVALVILRFGLMAILVVLWVLKRKHTLFRFKIVANFLYTLALLTKGVGSTAYATFGNFTGDVLIFGSYDNSFGLTRRWTSGARTRRNLKATGQAYR